MKKYLLVLVQIAFLIPVVIAQVTVSGRSILLNGSTYRINGVAYDVIGEGQTRMEGQDYSKVQTDITLLKLACVNTIRSYTPITDISVLNAFSDAGIRIIMGFPNFDDRVNPGPDLSSGTYLDYINTYKNHPAILFWEFGNEYNYHPEWFGNSVSNWYKILNDCAKAAHLADPNHPVGSAHGECPDADALSACPDVDVWGMNLYRYDDPSTVFPQWASLSQKPMYLSEAGADSYDYVNLKEDEQMQAVATDSILKHVMKNQVICSGITLFEFTDDWSSSGEPTIHNNGGAKFDVPYDKYGNTEYFGLVNRDRKTKQVFTVMKNKYCNFTVTAIKEESSDMALQLFPNPVYDGVVHLNAEANIESVQITNILGEIVYTQQFDRNNKHVSLQIQTLSEGIYIVQLKTQKTNISRRMVVKK